MNFGHLIVSGTVNLIIPDGVTMRCSEGFIVNEFNTLNIYGQANDSGTLDVFNSVDDEAGIGGLALGILGTTLVMLPKLKREKKKLTYKK